MSIQALPKRDQLTPLDPSPSSAVSGGPPTPGVSATAVVLPRRLRELGDRVPVTVLVLVLAGELLIPGGWARLGWWPVAAGLLAGLPHGAVDHLVPSWAQHRRVAPGPVVRLAAGYLLAAAVMLAVLRLSPLPGLVLFLLLSVAHFGLGEASYAGLRGAPTATGSPAGTAAAGSSAAPLPLQAVAVLAWGGTTVLLPLVRWPAQVGPVLDALAPGAGHLVTPGARGAVLVVVLAAAAITCAVAAVIGRYRSAAELGLLVAVFLLVPPLVAFAAYFGAWHSVRHIMRMLAVDPANAADLLKGRAARPLRRIAGKAALPTAFALATLVALVAATHGHQEFLAADFALLGALTAPHMLTVAWLDVRSGQLPQLVGGRR